MQLRAFMPEAWRNIAGGEAKRNHRNPNKRDPPRQGRRIALGCLYVANLPPPLPGRGRAGAKSRWLTPTGYAPMSLRDWAIF